MNKFVLFFIGAVLSCGLTGQVRQVSMGAGYANQVYYDIQSDSRTDVNYEFWDLAFGTGFEDAAIFVNEASPSNMQMPAPELELYLSTATDFESDVDTNELMRIYNPDKSWSVGAFNTVKNSEVNPFDFGWGIYEPTAQTVFGNKVFVIKLRSGQYRKLSVDSFNGAVFSFRSALLDGSDLQNHQVNVGGLSDRTLIQFSFAQNSAVMFEPLEWDLQFARYEQFVFQNGAEANYIVTGILQNDDVFVAEANDIDPTSVSFEEYADDLSDTIDIIGFDWKFFDLPNLQWVIDPNTVYFVQANDEIYQLQLLDFEGSFSGTTTFQLDSITTLSVDPSLPPYVQGVSVYPNPTSGQFQVSLNSDKTAARAQVDLYSLSGQLIQTSQINVNPGLNVYNLSLDNAPAGMYQLSLRVGEGRSVYPIQVIR